jgi:glycosyltransferase involved in cell wall biosynthesis
MSVGCHVLLEDEGDAAPIPNGNSEIRLFCKCRNESLRLPAFLRHYRALGVRRFFFVDNASTDGTLQLLRGQSDVRVFRTPQSFREARGGTDWLNALLGQFGVGHWCVTVDADELLYFPGSERTGLPALTQYLDEQGHQAMYCLLLDMYPGSPLRDVKYAPGDALEVVAPYFDFQPYRRTPHHECPGFLVYGGVRERVFYPEARAGDLRRDLHVNLYHRLLPRLPLVGALPPVHGRRPLFPPCLTKVPLVRWEADTRYLNVNHFVSPRKVAPESGALLHFKLLQDFDGRVATEVARGEYYDGASEFRRYAERLKENPGLTFMYDGSLRFKDSDQLVRLGLMTDSQSWSRRRTTASQPEPMRAR